MDNNRQKVRDRLKQKLGFNPTVSPISAYLAQLRVENPDGADKIVAGMIDIFTSENGRKFMNLLDISILQISLNPEVSDRALREHNAHRNLVNDLRRIISNG